MDTTILSLTIIFSIPTIIFVFWYMFKKEDQRVAEIKKRNQEYEAKKKQGIEENEPKKEAYFKWLNENYSPSKIIDFYSYNFYSHSWQYYEKNIIAIDENKKVVIFSKKEVPFENIIHCELITSTSQTHTTNTDSFNSVIDITTNINTEITAVKIYIADISEPEIIYYSSCVGQSQIKNIYSTMLAIISISKK